MTLLLDGLWGAKFLRRRVDIRLDNGHFLRIEYGNVFDAKEVVVIQVNDCFDTVIKEGGVSDRSIHGQFLRRFDNDGMTFLEHEKAA